MSIILWSAFCVIISRVKEKSRVIFCRIVAKSIDRIDFLGMSIFLFSFCIKNVLKKKTTNKQNKQNRLRNQNGEKKRTSPPKKKTKKKKPTKTNGTIVDNDVDNETDGDIDDATLRTEILPIGRRMQIDIDRCGDGADLIVIVFGSNKKGDLDWILRSAPKPSAVRRCHRSIAGPTSYRRRPINTDADAGVGVGVGTCCRRPTCYLILESYWLVDDVLRFPLFLRCWWPQQVALVNSLVCWFVFLVNDSVLVRRQSAAR